MDKQTFKKWIVLGIASGVSAASSGYTEGPSVDANSPYLLAKPACKGANGCGGLTAARDIAADKDEESDLEEDQKESRNAEARKKKQLEDKNDGSYAKPTDARTAQELNKSRGYNNHSSLV